ncbi:hypothetical protein Hdeb2414_s0011g00362241 [Helianthus debilis subsp. tardiflorus]
MMARVPAKVETSEDEPLVTTKKPWRSLTNFWCEFESRMQSVSIQVIKSNLKIMRCSFAMLWQ